MGETSRDLFDRVFVRLQVTFILLASLMILVITQTEKAEYLASIRSRSSQLAEFVRTNVDYFRGQSESLPKIIEREDFLQRALLGFGHLPELKAVRVVAEGQVATFEIASDGEIHADLKSLSSTGSPPRPDAEDYFVIQTLPLAEGGAERVEFYGAREFLNRHIGKRILVIFSLFTGMVALSTLMIGLVVRSAGATIRRQARELEETNQQLMQASKLAALGELAAGVAHEVNNPATVILSRASFLLSQEELNLSPSDREDLTAIVSQAQRIAGITGSLLRSSRHQALELRPVAIERVIESSLSLVNGVLAANHVSVEINLPPGLPHVLANEDSLARALENLFRNAVDAMPGGGALRLCATKGGGPGEDLRLEVADNGLGIEQAELSRIFDPFYTTKEVGKGTGLGLSIVHSIIKAHHGKIVVESRPSVGTKFTITLPTEE